jgi:glycerophosphoryl diester phosphodiesterase
MKQIKKIPRILLFQLLVVLAVSGAELSPLWYQHKTVAHALGGIQGFTYTNSREALELNYRRGHRVFEVDLQTTSDGIMVARHDWGQALAELLEQVFDPARPIQSYLDFRSQRTYRKFSPLSLRDIAEFMAAHEDIWLVTDTKTVTEAGASSDFDALMKVFCDAAPLALERVIPQIYNQQMLGFVRGVFPFKHIIYTLYQASDGDDSVIEFCKKNNISVVAMPPARLSDLFAKKLNAAGIRVYIHTINNSAEVRQLFRRGVHGVYTDHLVPGDWNVER